MAAAFGALVSLQHNLNLIHNHPRRHSFSFEGEQIQFLQQSVNFLIDFMKSYNNAHGARKEAAEALEMRIARAAEAAEDVVESHVVEQIRGGKTKPSRFLLDLQKVIQVMDYMRRKALQVYSRSGMGPTATDSATSSTPQTSNMTTSTTMVGFDDVLVQLLDKLTGVPSSRQVIPIVGMGGIGKTTLATNAFQHSLIVHHFDVCLWATISQYYSLHKILVQLLSHLRKSTSGTVDEVQERLYKSLWGRRYLIILDDTWSVEVWDEIKFLFPDTQNGSRIVVTTRQLDVARYLAISWVIRVSLLDEDNSWDLFCQKAFAEQGCPSELEEVGKEIVRKCKGLPLTIVVVAGHLKKSSMALEYWEDVALSILSSTVSDEQCLNVLSLSYSYLPAHLKPCFLLLGAFPEDEVIYVSNVAQLWIAEGFLEHFEDASLEEVAEYYLWDLYQRNLILVDRFGFSVGKVCKFKLHDLVRELCLKIAKKEEFLCVVETPSGIDMERRVVIRGEVGEVNHQTKTFGAPLRCLMYEGGWLSCDWKLLRTLDTVVTASTSESIFQQLNLRFVNVELDYTTLRTLYYLPSSISLLWNLQILTISTPDHATVIAPYEIWEMLQLRHVEVHPIRLLDPLPTERSDDELVLRNLHTLGKVENFRLSEEACKRIPNIRVLRLSYSYCDEASSYYCPHNLCYFNHLEILVMHFDSSSKWHDFVLSLTFPSSLVRLNLTGCGIDWEELTMMIGSLPHLVSLRLYRNSVVGSAWSPVDGKFLSLKYLDICGCDDLIKWNADNSHFPVLQSLYLSNLSKLEEFPSGIGEIPTLELITLKFCTVSLTISTMRTAAEQEELGNDSLRLDVVLRGDEETLESFNNIVQEEALTSTNLSLHLQNIKTKSL